MCKLEIHSALRTPEKTPAIKTEGVGFEPTWGESPPSDFESAPLGLSGIPPETDYMFPVSPGAW